MVLKYSVEVGYLKGEKSPFLGCPKLLGTGEASVALVGHFALPIKNIKPGE